MNDFMIPFFIGHSLSLIWHDMGDDLDSSTNTKEHTQMTLWYVYFTDIKYVWIFSGRGDHQWIAFLWILWRWFQKKEQNPFLSKSGIKCMLSLYVILIMLLWQKRKETTTTAAMMVVIIRIRMIMSGCHNSLIPFYVFEQLKKKESGELQGIIVDWQARKFMKDQKA